MRKTAPPRPIVGRLSLCFVGVVGTIGFARGQDPKVTTAAPEVYRREVLETRGDPGRGRRLFEDTPRTRCIACHAVDGQGGKLGPDLVGVGARLTPRELLEAIVDPSAKIHPDYASSTIATRSGRVLTGLVRPASEAEIDVATSETESIRLALAEVEERKASPVSLMPAGLHQGLRPAEMADLLAYLGRLDQPKSLGPQEAIEVGEIPRAARPVAFRPIHSRSVAFRKPVWFESLPGHPGTFAVAELQSGRIWRLREGADGGTRAPFADFSAETTPGDITGIMGLAFHPDFARNRRYFVKMHAVREGGRLAVVVVERKASEDGLADAGIPSKLIIKIPVFSEIHNGGQIGFGPDGFLYLGMGDTGPQGDPRGHAQDLGQLLGKMLRVDVDRPEGDRPYAIPLDNPFRDRPGARPEVWAYGMREPWRFSFDRPTGDLWVGDVGQGRYEEVAVVRAGENHGWNVLEGHRPHSERFRAADAAYVPPVFAYSHRVGVSVTGGFVYRGTRQPALVGKYVFGDYETRRLWALERTGGAFASIVEIGRAPERIVSFGVDPAGELYMVGFDNGVIYRIDPAGADLTALQTRELVPTSRRGPAAYRFTLRPPADDWAAPGFDDASWTAAPGGFGSPDKANDGMRTEWRTPDIWVRRAFTLGDGVDPAHLTLSAYHDEDAEIYLNGVLAARVQGFVDGFVELPISPEARAVLRPGPNVLAAHCHQTRGGQYIDVGIVETKGLPAGTPADRD